MKAKEVDKYNGNVDLTLKEENEILKIILKEYVSKSITYKELFNNILKLLDKCQDDMKILEKRINLTKEE